MGASVFARYFDVFTSKPGSPDAERHGRFAVPGEQVVELPQGRVRIYYDEAYGFPADDNSFQPPRDLEVSIADADSGEDVPIRLKLRLGAACIEHNDFSRAYVGRIEVPRAGRYRVVARVQQPSPHDPHLSLGK